MVVAVDAAWEAEEAAAVGGMVEEALVDAVEEELADPNLLPDGSHPRQGWVVAYKVALEEVAADEEPKYQQQGELVVVLKAVAGQLAYFPIAPSKAPVQEPWLSAWKDHEDSS